MRDRIPDFIEMIEAQGASDFATSSLLPRIIMTDKIQPSQTIEVYNSLGIEVLEETNNILFYHVKFPPGWIQMPTGHDMWTDIFDDRNRLRMSVFFKASPHDLRAHTLMRCRYVTESVYTRDKQNKIIAEWIDVIDQNDKSSVFSTKDITLEEGLKDYQIHTKRMELCKQWLKENFPEYENFRAYWD